MRFPQMVQQIRNHHRRRWFHTFVGLVGTKRRMRAARAQPPAHIKHDSAELREHQTQLSIDVLNLSRHLMYGVECS